MFIPFLRRSASIFLCALVLLSGCASLGPKVQGETEAVFGKPRT
jgi:hypothetical protein